MTAPDASTAGEETRAALAVMGEPEVPAAAARLVTGASELIADSLGEYTRIWLRRIRSGESGVLPVVIGLIILVAYFQISNSVFLSAGNLVNLMTQAAFLITFGMAEVFVLLLGEIDLSVGFNAALGAVVTLWMLSLSSPFPLWVAVPAGLAFSAAFAALEGFIVTMLKVPSFVVTLAGYLGGYGLLLLLVDKAAPGSGGTIRLTNNLLSDIEYGALNPMASWIVMAAAVGMTGVLMIVRNARRRSSNLAAPPRSVVYLKIATMAVVGVVIVLVSDVNRGLGTSNIRGVPWAVVVILALLVAFTTLLNRTRFGRYVYAMGGNAEAARRAGINLGRIRVLAFALCGLTAGISGLVYASNLGSISNNFQGGQYVLYAVAAAVIGGTSLVGGRGRMLGAVLGGLVVGVIFNGLSILGGSAARVNIWAAFVLLAAVLVDALARRGSAPR